MRCYAAMTLSYQSSDFESFFDFFSALFSLRVFCGFFFSADFGLSCDFILDPPYTNHLPWKKLNNAINVASIEVPRI